MNLTEFNSSPDPLPRSGGDNTPIPDGKYGAECIGFKAGAWPSGDRYIEFEYVVNGPSCSGRHVWQRTDLHPDAERRGESKRDDIARAIGLPKLTDANQAIGKQFTITLKTPGKYTNVVRVESYGAHSGAPPAQATQLPQAPAATNNNGAMPWGSPPPAAPPQGQQEVPF